MSFGKLGTLKVRPKKKILTYFGLENQERSAKFGKLIQQIMKYDPENEESNQENQERSQEIQAKNPEISEK